MDEWTVGRIVFTHFFMPCLILRMPLRKTILLCGGDGIELDWLDRVDIETVGVDDDDDDEVLKIKRLIVFAAAPSEITTTKMSIELVIVGFIEM